MSDDVLSARRTRDDELAVEEFRALRATIRERGTARVLVSAITFVSWGALALVLVTNGLPVPFCLIPLTVLWVGFEVVFSVHVAVERIGRYVRIFYETSGRAPKWETAIAVFGQSAAARATPVSALLDREFAIAVVLNLLASLLTANGLRAFAEAQTALALVAGLHALVLLRLFQAQRQVSRQRVLDGAEFQSISDRLVSAGPESK